MRKPTKTGNKTAAKFAVSPRSGAVIPLGAHPGNTGGKPGRSGRPRDEFRNMLREDAEVVRRRLMDKLASGELDELRFFELCLKYGVGVQKEHSGPNGGPITLLRVEYEDSHDVD